MECKNSLDGPWYVIDKDINQNKLYVSQNQSPLIYSGEVELIDLNFINENFNNDNIKVRFRHGGMLRNCDFKISNDRYIINLKDSERGIAPGQAAVFYKGSQCLGGGIVKTKCLNKS